MQKCAGVNCPYCFKEFKSIKEVKMHIIFYCNDCEENTFNLKELIDKIIDYNDAIKN